MSYMGPAFSQSLYCNVIPESTVLATSTDPRSIDLLDMTQYQSAEYLVTVANSSAYETIKVIALHDGTTANIVQYANTTAGTNDSLGDFTADISSGYIDVKFTPILPNTTIRWRRIAITAIGEFGGEFSLPEDLETGSSTIDLMLGSGSIDLGEETGFSLPGDLGSGSESLDLMTGSGSLDLNS